MIRLYGSSDLNKFSNYQLSALKFFLINRTFFSHCRSEQFSKQNNIFLHSKALSGFTLHNPNVLQIALLKLKKNLNSIQGLTQRVLKPYMNSGASITYLGLSNDRNDGLDEEDKEVCKNTVNDFLKSLYDKVQPNAPS